jgi:hypothetical protein
MTFSNLDLARQVHGEGKVRYSNGEYASAVHSFRDAVTILEVGVHKHNMETIKSYWRMGRAQWLSHEKTTADARRPMDHAVLAESIGSFKRCLRLAEDGFGMDHVATRTLRDDIERFVKKHGKANGAVQQLWRAATEALEQERHGDELTSQHQYIRAVECYRRVMELERSAFGTVVVMGGKNAASASQPGTLDFADVTCKMARLERLQGNASRSLAAFSIAHKIYNLSWGEAHPSTMAAAANIRSMQ